MSDRPYFSVIIPTYARPRLLSTCLASLAGQDYPADAAEVVVADDGSPEPLDEVVAPWRDRFRLTLIRKPNGGPGSARNAGARVSRGQYLAFTADDCRPAPNWLSALAGGFEQAPERMLGGRIVNRLVSNPYSAASQLIVDLVYAHYNHAPDQARFFTPNNLAVPAALFRQLGGFNEDFFKHASEDRELCDRWLSAGHRLTYVPEAVVRHGHALTFCTFCKQHFTYGRGAWHYQHIRALRGSGQMRDDLGFHGRLLPRVRDLLARLPRGQARAVAPLLVVWQAAYAAGFFGEMLRVKMGHVA